MLDLNNKIILKQEIKRIESQIKRSTGLYVLAVLSQDLEYLKSKLNK